MTNTDKKYLEIDRLMTRYDVEPEGLTAFAEKQLPHYLFYSQKNKHAYCTACKHTFKPFKGLKHNEPTTCPECGATVTARSEGRGSNIANIIWSVWAQNDGDDICLHYYRTLADYNGDYEHPEIVTTEQFRNVFNDAYHDYMWWHSNVAGYDRRERWLPYANRGNMFWGAFRSELYEPYNVRVFGDLTEALSRSRFKYCPIAGLLAVAGRRDDGCIEDYAIDRWLNIYQKAPQIELVFKVGFKKLVLAVAQGKVKLDRDATNIRTALGITNRQFKKLLDLGDPTPEQYRMIRDFDCSLEEIPWLIEQDKHSDSIKKLKSLVDYAPLGKIIPYLADKDNDVNSYHDYVSWMVKLGCNMDNKDALFPKDFWKAHDRMMEVYYNEQDKPKNDKIARIAKKVKLDLHCNGMFIRPARSATELRKEGEALHHCVATYADKMASGETVIMFIRKDEEPDKPFYTMEVRGDRIIQLRGLRNCGPTPEVEEFRDEFEKVLKRTTNRVKAAA